VTANIGGADGTLTERSDLLYRWENGDPTWLNSGSMLVGDWGGVATNVLDAPLAQRYMSQGHVYPFAPSHPQRRGVTKIVCRVFATTFGAGTVRVSGHLVLGLNQIIGQRQGVYQTPIGLGS
jgi:hypothetical protein